MEISHKAGAHYPASIYTVSMSQPMPRQLFLDMCFPQASVSAVVRITDIDAEKNGDQSEVPHPSSIFLNRFCPFPR